MLLSLSVLYCLLLTFASCATISKRDSWGPASAYAALDYRTVMDTQGAEGNYFGKGNPVRGVNLGGWLVIEPWMNTDFVPSGTADEFSFCSNLGYSACGDALEKHYSSYITEDDFLQMLSLGLNAVRIPIGYWAFKLEGPDKFNKGSQEKYLQKALGWAKNHNIKVMIDLHGVPGSQNGYDSSGHKDTHDWAGYSNMDETKQILNYIFAKYGGNTYGDTVMGIELVNEPLTSGQGSVTADTLSNWYAGAIDQIRNLVKSKQRVVLQDGYLPQGTFNGKSYNSQNVWYDTHMYVLYASGLKDMSLDDKVKQVCTWGSQLASNQYPTVVGEFTAAWDSNSNGPFTKAIGSWTSDQKAQMTRFVEAQFNAFEKNYGWFFWNWKSTSDQWSFQALVKAQVIPSPVTLRSSSECK